MPNYPTRKTASSFLALEDSKSAVIERIQKHDDPYCAALLQLIQTAENLAVELHFQAECQEYIDALHSARAYTRAVQSLEEMVPLLQRVADEITFRPSKS